MAEKTLFEKILNKEIPGDILFEDDKCFVLKDINPQAPVHILIIPKTVITRLGEASDNDAEALAHLLLVARDQAKALGITEGFRTVINSGRQSGETVPHLHLHVLGGRGMTWPPG